MKIKDINIFNTVGFYIKGKKQWLNDVYYMLFSYQTRYIMQGI
jgi:hypothetical protein